MTNLPDNVDENDPDAPWNDDQDRSTPMLGECAVCGRPVPAAVPPEKDHRDRFCDDHDEDDRQVLAAFDPETKTIQIGVPEDREQGDRD